MCELGKYNTLKVIKESGAGVHLDGGPFGELVLPREEVPSNYHTGKEIEVFLYTYTKDKTVPTTKKPYATVGEFAGLEVTDVSAAGAFLDWGLPRDLFIPLSEQQEKMEKGESYIVYIYMDTRCNRVAVSAKLDEFLNKEPAVFQNNDKVDLLICRQTEIGYEAIINNSHWGLLYRDEVFQTLEFGQKMEGYIKKMREDGKIDLSLQVQGYQKMDSLEEKIISYLNSKDGEMSITDKSPPEMIYEVFGVSKKKYKMALGALYKSKRILIENDVVKIKS